MKTPEEIKKGLECCLFGQCGSCPYSEEYGCDCSEHLRDDIREYHNQLEAERDAAVKDLCYAVSHPHTAGVCYACKHHDACQFQDDCDIMDNNHWEWRGVQKEG